METWDKICLFRVAGHDRVAPRYTADDRLAVRDRFPIEVAVGKRVGLQRKGNRYLGPCPFHNEKAASFEVSPKKGTFCCYGCGAYGDVVEW